jgi:hypothetical protein
MRISDRDAPGSRHIQVADADRLLGARDVEHLQPSGITVDDVSVVARDGHIVRASRDGGGARVLTREACERLAQSRWDDSLRVKGHSTPQVRKIKVVHGIGGCFRVYRPLAHFIGSIRSECRMAGTVPLYN